MDYLAEHPKILERAEANLLPVRIVEGCGVSVQTFRELFEQGLVDAADTSGDEGLE